MAALVIPAARSGGDAFPMPRRRRRRAVRFILGHRARIEALIDHLVAMLDAMDGDTDLEPAVAEPSLGWPEQAYHDDPGAQAYAPISDLCVDLVDTEFDDELDDDDDAECSLQPLPFVPGCPTTRGGGRMSTSSRRTLLTAPIALAALPAAAVPVPIPNNPSCFDLRLRAAELIRQHRALDADSIKGDQKHHAACTARMGNLVGEIGALNVRILRTRARTVPDVVAKLLIAMERIEEAKHDIEALEPCEDAEAAVRDCVFALADLTRMPLIAVAADWTDRELGLASARGQA